MWRIAGLTLFTLSVNAAALILLDPFSVWMAGFITGATLCMRLYILMKRRSK